MDRLQKKCLVASAGMHLFLGLLLVLGSAFVSNKKPVPERSLQFVPGILVDALVSGGGGNPNIAPSDDRIKGDTLRPQPKDPEPVPPPPPKKKPKKVEPKIEPKKIEPKKVEPVPVKKNGKEAQPKEDDILKHLKPVVRTAAEKKRQRAEAEARRAAEEAQRMKGLKNAIAKVITHSEQGLRAGFKDGTKVEIYGPGGVAYANYASFVKAAYEDAWSRFLPNDFLDEDATTKVAVTIDRSGNVVSKRIEQRSGNSVLDKSVQRALDSVSFVAPFPEGTRDQERTFTINFNLKAKQLSG